MKVLVIGSINMDFTMKVKRLPRKGETLTAGVFHVAAGGKGANQAVAAAKLGGSVAMIGALGKDEMGTELQRKLEAAGIETTAIKWTEVATGNAMITVDDNGDNTIIVYPGSNSDLDSKWISQHEKHFREAAYIMVQLEIPLNTVGTAIKTAKKYDCTVILNPAPAKTIPMELYPFIDLITPNETELAVLTGTSDIEQGARILLERGVKKVVVTLGDRGCYYTDGKDSMSIGSFKVQAIDTTAAGDTFNGALCIALMQGKNMHEALRFANAAGALSTTRLGAQEAVPSRREVENMVNK